MPDPDRLGLDAEPPVAIEVAAAADLLLVLHIGSAQGAEKLKQLTGRVSAMSTRLIARLA